MHRPDHATAVGGLYVPINPGIGQPATVVSVAQMNDIVEGLCRLVEGAGLTLVKGNYDQLRDAVRVIGAESQQFGTKNLLINGNFRFWQRGNPVSLSGGLQIGTASRWKGFAGASGGTATVSRQQLNPFEAPAPSSGPYYLRWQQTAGGLLPYLQQRLEQLDEIDARTMTESVYMRVSSGTLQVTPQCIQNFGSGGSPQVTTNGTPFTVTTTWTRFPVAFAVPSISGKTVGPGAYTAFGWKFPDSTTFTLDVHGAQVEASATVTPFEGIEEGFDYLRLSRFEWKSYDPDTAPGTSTSVGALASDDVGNVVEGLMVRFPTTMRAVPALRWFSPVTGAVDKVHRNGADRDIVSQPYLSQTQLGGVETAIGTGITLAHVFADAEL